MSNQSTIKAEKGRFSYLNFTHFISLLHLIFIQRRSGLFRSMSTRSLAYLLPLFLLLGIMTLLHWLNRDPSFHIISVEGHYVRIFQACTHIGVERKAVTSFSISALQICKTKTWLSEVQGLFSSTRFLLSSFEKTN